MNDENRNVENCPFCGAIAEIGCLMGNLNGLSNGLQWYEGEPTVWKNIFPVGESLGDFEIFKGPNLKGLRCTKCRKLVLNY